MTNPTIDVDNLRRQFPQEIVNFFDAVVEAKFDSVEDKFEQIDDKFEEIDGELADLDETIAAAATEAASQAEADFVESALEDIAEELEPLVSEQVSEEVDEAVGTKVEDEMKKGVFNERTGSRYKFHIDSEANIEALPERQERTIYIGTENDPENAPENFDDWDLHEVLYSGTLGQIVRGYNMKDTKGEIKLTRFSDGKSIIIADRNIGATNTRMNTAVHGTGCYGNYFQRGNNNPFTATPTTSSTKVNASAYGAYKEYSSSTYITASAQPYDWSSNKNDSLWSEGAQGPCQTGMHIPSAEEHLSIVAVGAALGLWSSRIESIEGLTSFQTYLKFPLSGYRGFTGNVTAQGTQVRTWETIKQGTNIADTERSVGMFYVYYNSTYGISVYQTRTQRACAYTIRAFADVPVVPDSNWTTLFDGSSVAAGAGIFHNATEGLISLSSDGENWITIQDKNVGATDVYNYGDTLSEANCGKYFQRGNNYGFPRASDATITTSSTQVDTTGYGATQNYYSGTDFITTSNDEDWSSVSNDNLRGGDTDSEKAMQGPCPDGYHIPSVKDKGEMVQLLGGILGRNVTVDDMGDYLLLPKAGYLGYSSGSSSSVGEGINIWTCSSSTASSTYSGGYLYSSGSPNSTSTTTGTYNRRGTGIPIRPFKNTK